MSMRVGAAIAIVCFGALCGAERARGPTAAGVDCGEPRAASPQRPLAGGVDRLDFVGGVGAAALALGVPVLLLPVPVPVAAPRPGTECNLHSGDVKLCVHDATHGGDPDIREQKPRRLQRPRPAPRRPTPPAPDADYDESPAAPPALPVPYPAYVHADQLDETPTSPPFGAAASSKELVEQFRAQAPSAPLLPPLLLSEHDSSERVLHDAPPDDPHDAANAPLGEAPSRGYLPAPAPGRGREPARPRFTRSLLLRGELTVPRADYTETYTAWWDAASGSARVDFYGGSAATFRTARPDGTVQRLEMRLDRSGDGTVRRCGVAARRAATPADRAPPALPDLELFSFAGYAAPDGDERVERWQHTRAGAAGELGAARGELLGFHHELLLRRAPDGGAVPLMYSVAVNSSVLGADCDGYEHRYVTVQEQSHDPDFFTPNIDELCDSVEQLNGSAAEHFARLDPLHEFTLPHRDLQYDAALERFVAEYGRQYADGAEEAVRKTQLVQHLRFTRAANREGATFELGLNFLGDRLDVELEQLLGVRGAPERERAERFPHSRTQLRAAESELPARFDWRPRGAVSPVRYQGSCASCWAFAVAGAVEGALFVRTRRLTPLSEKCLVDCAHPFGGNGCRGTWPSHAYDYVQSRGLPALADYPPYKEKVERCAEASVTPVTRISAHVNVTALSVTALKVAVRRHAPSVVIVDAKAKSFVFYKKGVLYDDRCGKAGARLNHAVLAVGWGARRGEPHFVLKNSWSEAWGERGYVRVQARANTCGVLAKPSYPRLERADVQSGEGARGARGASGSPGAPGARPRYDTEEDYDY